MLASIMDDTAEADTQCRTTPDNTISHNNEKGKYRHTGKLITEGAEKSCIYLCEQYTM